MPKTVFGFLKDGIAEMVGALPAHLASRVSGIGIAAPFEIWKWHEIIGAPVGDFSAWEDIDFHSEVAKFSDLPLTVVNDATAACRAENIFGQGKELTDYAYFFVGSFIGGGVVLNHAVYEGRFGNAGALGALQSVDAKGRSVQLLDTASLHLLETAMIEAGLDPSQLWVGAKDWTAFAAQVDPWCRQAAREIAKAALSACAVIDFEAIVIDGAFPPHLRAELTGQIRHNICGLDTRGLVVPKILEGNVGANARVMGAAYGPVSVQHFLTGSPGLGAAVE